MGHGPGWYAYMQGQLDKQNRAAAREDYLIMNSEGDCPKCGSTLLKRSGSKGVFLGCSNYPDCSYTQRIKSDNETSSWSGRSSRTTRTASFDFGLSCPKCSGKLRKRSGKFGEFYGCSNYPTCTYTKRI